MQNGREVRQQAGPLNGWRAIAEYLGRNQSTVKRWATDGDLPVHRPKGSAARKGVPVYAFSSELDAWLKGHQPEIKADEIQDLNGHVVEYPADPHEAEVEPLVSQGPAIPPPPRIGRRKLVAGGLAIAGCVALGLAAWWQRVEIAIVRTNDLPPEARQLYVDAQYLWQQRTPDSLRQAEQILLRVRQLAPRFAAAQADLATVYNLMVEYGVLPPQDGYERSKAAAGLAIALDPDLAQAYSVLGDITVFWDRDYELGMNYFERALALDPQDAQARHWHAAALMSLGRFEPAAEEIMRAREIEPLSRSIGVSSAMVQLGLGRPDTARTALLQIIDLEPGYRSPWRFLAFAELARMDYPAYLNAWETRFTLTADYGGLAIVRAGKQALERGGAEGMVQAMLASAQTVPANGAADAYSLAHVFALAGDWESAGRHLGETPTRHAFYYGIDPAFTPARQNERFLQIIADARLPVIRAFKH
ncbi:tetratricopeptide repeat protein [Agrobacterium pusense]|uniref:tetratricopeptide repeat protein n=2 Tax=Agrobacterium TaxID=357 RepID=UPI000D1BA13F|nr:tetratricopeptide repeat protein [Agrobacterium pusense]